MDLNNHDYYSQIDSTNVKEYLFHFPDQIKSAKTIVDQSNIPRLYDVDKIIITGNEHNALAGKLLQSYLYDKTTFPIFVIQKENLPKWVNKHTLVLLISYSGDDLETNSIFKEAVQKHCKIIGVSSSGHLQSYCNNRNLPHIKIPDNHSSRLSIAFLFFSSLFSLLKTGLFQLNIDIEINDCITQILDLRKTINPSIPLSQNKAKEIASSIGSKNPQIFGWDIFSPVSIYWSMILNQNAKISANSFEIPSSTYYATVGWANQKVQFNYYNLIFRDNQLENKEMKKRLHFIEEFFHDLNHENRIIIPFGKYNLSKIWYLIYLGLYTSYYAAIYTDTDPGPTPIIHQLDEMLAIL